MSAEPAVFETGDARPIDVLDDTGFAFVRIYRRDGYASGYASIYVADQCIVGGLHNSAALRSLAGVLIAAADHMDEGETK